MRKHFVTFISPGTFVAEMTTKPIESWDVEQAVEMAHGIVERYGARPYGFQFSTRERADNELDSHTTEKSPIYYLGGRVLTLEDIEARNDTADSILISNMKGNGWDRVLENTNSYRAVLPLEANDVVLDVMLRELAKDAQV